MALVGDVIMDMRNVGPDLPPTLTLPLVQSVTPTTGGVLGAGTYYFVVSALNQWGESLATPEQSVTLTGVNNAISITVFLYPGTVSARVYITGVQGQENTYIPFPVAYGVQTLLITTSATGVVIGGNAPTRATAFLPDDDGGFVGVFTAYRWLNEGLQKAALITGGIQDWGGAGSVANQPMYKPPTGVWRKFDHAWYDGWELEQGTKAEIFRNKPITASISRIFAMDVNGAQQVMELYYIPSRTSAQTTTSATFNPTDTTVTLTSTAGFSGPPFGLVMIGTEVCFYASVQGNQLIGLTRGIAGTTVPTAAVASGAAVTELNILWNGFRMPVIYSPGQSMTTLDVPQGWAALLTTYMLAKFREAEQSRQEAASLFKEFETGFKSLAYSNRQLAGPRQARIFDSFGFRGVVPASAGGGLIVR